LYLQDGRRYVVVGSNYGRRHHPAWTGNLISTPDATVQIGERKERVLARRARAQEFERYWPRLLEIWPGWRTYRSMTRRTFRMFALEPIGLPTDEQTV